MAIIAVMNIYSECLPQIALVILKKEREKFVDVA